MKRLILATLLLVSSAPFAHCLGDGPPMDLLGQSAFVPPPAFDAGAMVSLRFLLPLTASVEALKPRLFQVGGALALPLDVEILVTPDGTDPRVTRVRFTAPSVTRVTELALRMGEYGAQRLVVFPAEATRGDRPSLSEALATSPLRLAVFGPSGDLRVFLRGQKLDFTDLGEEVPDRFPANTLLVGPLGSADWETLTARPHGHAARLLAFVHDPTLLPGVYVWGPQSGSIGGDVLTKITFPPPALLVADPRAREAFSTLLFTTLTSSVP